jgi:hypothetical protein
MKLVTIAGKSSALMAAAIYSDLASRMSLTQDSRHFLRQFGQLWLLQR